MWFVCVLPGKTSFTNEDDAVQALKNMNEGHEDKGVGKEDNAEVAERTRPMTKWWKLPRTKKKRRCRMPRPRVVVTNPMGMALPSRVGPGKA